MGPDGKAKLVELSFNAKPVIFALRADMRKRNPRDRYLMTAQLFTIRLAPCDLKNYPLPPI